jgi:hypothetical protein
VPGGFLHVFYLHAVEPRKHGYSFDDLISQGDERLRDRQAERLGSLQVDESMLGWRTCPGGSGGGIGALYSCA